MGSYRACFQVAFRCHLDDIRVLHRASEHLLITAFMNYLRAAQNNVALCKNEGCNGVVELEVRLFSSKCALCDCDHDVRL